MGIAIPGEGPLNVKRTLGSLVPHPAAIGRIMGAHLGIAAPRTKLAGGGPANTDITSQMFQPINPMGSVPNADINFIQSPQLQRGPGPVAGKPPTPQQQPNTMQDIAQTGAAANSLVNAGSGIYKAGSGILAGTGSNPSLWGSIQSGMAGNGWGGVLSGPGAQSALANGTNGFAPGMSLDTLGAGATTVPESAVGVGSAIDASAAEAIPAAADAAAAATAAGSGSALASFGSWLASLLPFALEQGGAVPGYADGGEVNSLTNMLMRREAGETFHPSGLLNSAGPGRTDTINTNVPTGAYVVPADVVSGLGEGNTLAGSAVIDRMFSSQPHGIQARPIRHGRGPISEPPPKPINPDSGPATVDTQFINSAGAYARGGKASDKAPVVVAGGEVVLHPSDIIRKFGSLKRGHQILDHWTVLMRKKIAKEMLSLPNPVGSKVRI